MNLREGTRRLALLLGAVGGIAGGFVSYVYLNTTLEQRARHNAFEGLANSHVVQRERQFLQDPHGFIPGPYPMTAAQFGEKLKIKFPEYKDQDDVMLTAKTLEKYPEYRDMVEFAPWEEASLTRQNGGNPSASVSSKGWTIGDSPPDSMDDGANFIHAPSRIDTGGIETINWAENYGVYSIETKNGQTVYSAPAPAAWEYLLVALLPVLGFLVPWGAIRAIGWVGAGFVASSK